MPDHFNSRHNGWFRASASLHLCTRCGKLDSCDCKQNNEEMDKMEMERRVRQELGLTSETRRY